MMRDLHSPIDRPVRDAGFHVNLERRDPVVNMARFYAIRMERTLFGQWAVIRQWGRIGGAGRSCESWFTDPLAALAEQALWEQRKRSRGYLSVRGLRLTALSAIMTRYAQL